MNEYVLETTNLVKQYGTQKAVDHISLHIKRGAIYGLIGKNGAGKSTFMKLISGLANPTAGEIRLFEEDSAVTKQGKTRIGVLIEGPGLYGDLTAMDNMKLKAVAMGVYHKEKLESLLALVGLDASSRKKTKHYSLGMKQRLGIALALIGSPDLLILDEPVNGLDPQGIIEVRELLKKLSHEYNMTILISSHILEELSKLVTDYGIIDHGQLLLEISAEDLQQKCSSRLELSTPNTTEAVTLLENLQIREYTVVNSNMIYAYHCLDQSSAIMEAFVNAHIPLTDLHIQNESLEEFYLKITGKEGQYK